MFSGTNGSIFGGSSASNEEKMFIKLTPGGPESDAGELALIINKTFCEPVDLKKLACAVLTKKILP